MSPRFRSRSWRIIPATLPNKCRKDFQLPSGSHATHDPVLERVRHAGILLEAFAKTVVGRPVLAGAVDQQKLAIPTAAIRAITNPTAPAGLVNDKTVRFALALRHGPGDVPMDRHRVPVAVSIAGIRARAQPLSVARLCRLGAVAGTGDLAGL